MCTVFAQGAAVVCREQQANLREIQYALDSDLLTENKMATIHAQDASRFKNDSMKGFLSTQRCVVQSAGA